MAASAMTACCCLGIAGAGAMGQGIAQVAIQGGLDVLLFDQHVDVVHAAIDSVRDRLDRLVEKKRLDRNQADAAVERLRLVASIDGFTPCDVVIEAIVEDLEAKRALFQAIEAVVRPDCIIASNTSSIPIASIAAACQRRERVAGLHFFNPVPLMKLVEVVRAVETSQSTLNRLKTLGERMTRTPVVVKDSPGFLVNMGGRAFTTEALRLAHEGVAVPAEIDAVMCDAHGFRMGPFELMDLTGIDVNYPVTQIIHDGYQRDPRLGTSPNHRALYDAGLLGRKSGSGWYSYEGGKALERPSPDFTPDADPARRVALAEEDVDLVNFLRRLGIDIVKDDRDCPIVAAPLGDDATHLALRTGCDFRRLVCLDLSGNTEKRVTVMTAPGADPAFRQTIAAALNKAGRKVTAIKDSPGFIGQRISAMIGNLGCYMAEIGLAVPADIDLAMTLGLNYPMGPLDLVDQLGAKRCLRILERLQAITGEDRYRPTLWLKRRAALGLPIWTEN